MKPNTLLKSYRFVAKFILAIIAISGLGSAPAVAAAEDLRIGVSRAPLSLPIYVAEAEGYFAAEGVRLRIVDCSTGRVCLGKMLGGDVELSTVANSPLVFASLEGIKFAILASISSSASNAKLVVRAGAGIANPKDLIGKKVGVFTGTTAQYFLDSYLLFYDIDPAQVAISTVKPEEVVEALRSARFDALAIFAPFTDEVLEKVVGAKALPAVRIVPGAFNLVSTPKALIGRDREIEAILRALKRANTVIRNNPERAKTILMSRLQRSRSNVESIWREYQYQLSMDQSLLASLESEARWAVRGGFVPNAQKVNLLDYLYPGPMQKVAPEFVTLFR